MTINFSENDFLVYDLIKNKKEIFFEDLKSTLNIDVDSIRRSLEYLKSNQVISEKIDQKNDFLLTDAGKFALDNFLIEEVFCDFIKDKDILISSLKDIDLPSLKPNEISLAFGISKKKNLISIEEGRIKVLPDFKQKISDYKEDLKKISNKDLNQVSQENIDYFLQRKFILKKLIINKSYLFLKEIKYNLEKDQIIYLTSDIIKSNNFQNIKFKEYDVSKTPSPAEIGRVHPLRKIMEYIRNLYIEMGFKEMAGPYVDTCFWPMDSMFISQDHPMRDLQDTFYLPLKGKLPKKSFLKKIKEVHENGMDTGSLGYQYKWDEEIAKNLVLRTHTTSVTFRTFYNLSKEEKNNSKYFCIGKVFRNESIDATHLAEFYQAEGFVIGKNISFSDLIGFIKEFLGKLGIEKIKIKPTYNPYTEPSIEVFAYSEKSKTWKEIINSGLFRKETLRPYGIKNNVIAWGIGIERIGMLLLEKTNIKEVFGDYCDIDFLRNYKIPKRKFE